MPSLTPRESENVRRCLEAKISFEQRLLRFQSTDHLIIAVESATGLAHGEVVVALTQAAVIGQGHFE
jgi:hypothetical protein